LLNADKDFQVQNHLFLGFPTCLEQLCFGGFGLFRERDTHIPPALLAVGFPIPKKQPWCADRKKAEDNRF